MMNNTEKVRLDAYLFAIRIFKTRSLSKEAISKGSVKINGQQAKAHKFISVNDEISIKSNVFTKIIIVKQLLCERVCAKSALLCYEETLQSKCNFEKAIKLKEINYVFSKEKPNKQDRQKLIKLKQNL